MPEDLGNRTGTENVQPPTAGPRAITGARPVFERGTMHVLVPGGPGGLTLKCSTGALKTIYRHAKDGLPRAEGGQQETDAIEMGGFLLGRAEYEDERHVLYVDHAIPLESSPYDQSDQKVFSPADRLRVERELRRHPGCQLVGDFHSHPGHEVKLSDQDVDYMNRKWPERHNVTVIAGPRDAQGTVGFFLKEGEGEAARFSVGQAPTVKVPFDAKGEPIVPGTIPGNGGGYSPLPWWRRKEVIYGGPAALVLVAMGFVLFKPDGNGRERPGLAPVNLPLRVTFVPDSGQLGVKVAAEEGDLSSVGGRGVGSVSIRKNDATAPTVLADKGLSLKAGTSEAKVGFDLLKELSAPRGFERLVVDCRVEVKHPEGKGRRGSLPDTIFTGQAVYAKSDDPEGRCTLSLTSPWAIVVQKPGGLLSDLHYRVTRPNGSSLVNWATMQRGEAGVPWRLPVQNVGPGDSVVVDGEYVADKGVFRFRWRGGVPEKHEPVPPPIPVPTPHPVLTDWERALTSQDPRGKADLMAHEDLCRSVKLPEALAAVKGPKHLEDLPVSGANRPDVLLVLKSYGGGQGINVAGWKKVVEAAKARGNDIGQPCWLVYQDEGSTQPALYFLLRVAQGDLTGPKLKERQLNNVADWLTEAWASYPCKIVIVSGKGAAVKLDRIGSMEQNGGIERKPARAYEAVIDTLGE